MEIKSSAFQEGGEIPKKYTCSGENVSPPLSFSGIPEGTKSLALICDDPDAPGGTWVHWVVYDLPAKTAGLPENVPKTERLENDAAQGLTDFGRIGYGGPCPPPGAYHRYFFKIYALSKMPGLSPGATKAQLLSAMEGSILSETQLIGRYKR